MNIDELPRELIGEEIMWRLNRVELIFSCGLVCWNWRRIVGGIIWKDCKEKILNFSNNEFVIDDYELFIYTKEGRKLTKYLIRKHLYRMACQFAKEDSSIISVIDELKYLKSVFNQFYDSQNIENQNSFNLSHSTLFESALSFIGSFFLPNTNSSANSSFDYHTKILLEGQRLSGKSTFLSSAMNNGEIIQNSMPPTASFAMKTVEIGQAKVKVEMWESAGERYRPLIAASYRRMEFILILVDPFKYSKGSSEYLNTIKEDIKKYAPKQVEVILITTKNDNKEEYRNFSNEMASNYAFNNFGGAFHFDISNNVIEQPKSILWYCVLLKYLLS